MSFNRRTAGSLASALPSFRFLLAVGGVLLLSESLLLATTMFVASALSFAASVVLGAMPYRASADDRPDARPYDRAA